MIPAVYVNVGEGALVAHCLANKIGIGSIVFAERPSENRLPNRS